MAFADPAPARHLSPARGRDLLDDACSGFTRVADRTVASAPLRTRPLDHARGPRYRGPGRLPGPDSHRQTALSLSLGYVMIISSLFMTPEQSGRTRSKKRGTGRPLASSAVSRPLPGWPWHAKLPELARPRPRSGAFGRLATQSSRSNRGVARSGGFARPGRTLPPSLPSPARPAETNPAVAHKEARGSGRPAPARVQATQRPRPARRISARTGSGRRTPAKPGRRSPWNETARARGVRPAGRSAAFRAPPAGHPVRPARSRGFGRAGASW
jgi:hypothetical protein